MCFSVAQIKTRKKHVASFETENEACLKKATACVTLVYCFSRQSSLYTAPGFIDVLTKGLYSQLISSRVYVSGSFKRSKVTTGDLRR